MAESIATDLTVTAAVPDELAGRRGNLVVSAQAGVLQGSRLNMKAKPSDWASRMSSSYQTNSPSRGSTASQ